MSLFDIGKICLFSEVNGQVLLNGKPLANTIVKQQYIWGQKPVERMVKTDAEGNFKFDAVFVRSLAKYMPVEAVIQQEIIIENNKEEYKGWSSVKRNFDENGELAGREINILCELTNEFRSEEIGLNLIQGICRWK